MATFIIPSSYRCDYGYQCDFFERTIREMGKISQHKPQYLIEGGHRIEFTDGFAVGAPDVDARTGAILDPTQRVAAIQARAAELAAALPAYAPNPSIAAEFLAPGAVTAQNIARTS